VFKHASEQTESRRSVTVKEHQLDHGRHRRGVAASTTVCRTTCSHGNIGLTAHDATWTRLCHMTMAGEEDLGVHDARAHEAVVVCRSGVRAAVMPTANMAKR